MKKGNKPADTTFVSLSDVMTGLMIIFLFIAVSYMVEVKKKDAQIDEVLVAYAQTKEDLYQEIQKELGRNFKNWQVEFDKDLSVKFTNPDILFASGSSEINPYFSQILNDFLPRYFQILSQEKYKGKIAEIRIEGHTDDTPTYHYGNDAYMGNVTLSQMRSASVLDFFRNTNYFKNLDENKKTELEFLLTANGLSYGRALDNDKKMAFYTEKAINRNFSRRVEFKIIPVTEQLLEKISRLKKNE